MLNGKCLVNYTSIKSSQKLVNLPFFVLQYSSGKMINEFKHQPDIFPRVIWKIYYKTFIMNTRLKLQVIQKDLSEHENCRMVISC